MADDSPTALADPRDTNADGAAIEAVERAVGGRDALLRILTHAPETDDLTYVINLIADPSMDARKLAAICRAGGVKLGALLEAFKRGAYAQLFVDRAALVATHMPAVMEDVIVRAAPHTVPCPTCHGRRVLTDESPCLVCRDANGDPTGSVTVLPDLDRQKLALDLADLLPKKGPVVAIDNRSLSITDASPTGHAKFLEDTEAILHPRRAPRPTPTVVTVEPVEPPTPSE